MPGRRAFIIGSAAVAGGVAIGYRRVAVRPKNPLSATLDNTQTALTPYVIIDPSGVSIIAPRAEMGQGIHTTLAALVAEELDIALPEVNVLHGPASEVYTNTVMFKPQGSKGRLAELRLLLRPPENTRATQYTGGQSSIQDGFLKMRQAGAAARLALIEAAARQWRVPADTLRTDNGTVVDNTGRRLSYTALARAATKVPLTENPPLRAPSQWKLLGKSQPRVDMLDKCRGTAVFSIDVQQPDMLFATVRRNPHLGSAMLGFDASKAEAMPGVIKIVPIEDGVIVVASNTWYAFRAADAITFDWAGPEYPTSTAGHRGELAEAMQAPYHSRPRDDGQVDAALLEAKADAKVIDGEYRAPYLAHAPMEPLNATALLRDGQLQIWAGNQAPTRAMQVGAALADIHPEQVSVHTTYMGGGFGRRLEMDFVTVAVQAALAVPGTPVKVTWSREEDMSRGVYRPQAMARFRAGIVDGTPVALDLQVSSLSLVSSADQRYRRQPNGRPDKFMVTGVADQPYQIPNYRVTAYRARNLLPVTVWRSVGESQNSFFHECIMDEMAHAAGVDPLMLRLDALKHEPSRAVLEQVAALSDWHSERPPGHALGLAYVLSSGAATAQVIEVRRAETGIEILNAFVAVDVGIALDPRNIEAQISGSLIFGLAAAMTGEITIRQGAVEQTNFHNYPVLRISQVPNVTVSIHQSGEEIFGVGESATASAAPALGNAIFAATGLRLRELPLARFVDFV